MDTSQQTVRLAVFPTSLGWMAVSSSGSTVRKLTFGHRLRQSAIDALDESPARVATADDWSRQLIQRLKAYAEGSPEDFRDVRIDPGQQTAFQRRVTACCRRIPFGATLTYGELAARAGFPAAARAVGSCMAANRIPLVIPCHRVVAAGGGLGGYSSRGGVAMKRRLLALEAGNAPTRRVGLR